MPIRLTKRVLRAIEEALTARLAGEIDIADDAESPDRNDYERALEWVEEQDQRRAAKKKDR